MSWLLETENDVAVMQFSHLSISAGSLEYPRRRGGGLAIARGSSVRGARPVGRSNAFSDVFRGDEVSVRRGMASVQPLSQPPLLYI